MSIVNLPSGYRQVEYIESTGTQFVDTGVVPNQDTRVVFKGRFTYLDSTGAYAIFGTRYSTTSKRFEFLSSAGNFYSAYNTSAGPNTAGTTDDILIDKNKNVTSLNGTTFSTHTYAAFECGANLNLFADNSNGIASIHAQAECEYAKIYDNGTLVRDFIPCINPSGVVGLYDLVNGKFYGNSGTGVFTAGRKVYKESEVTKLEYIESDGSQYVDTEFKPNQDTRVVMDFNLLSVKGQYADPIFGVRTSASSNAFYLWASGYAVTTEQYQSGYNNASHYVAVTRVGRHTVDKNKNVTTIDGVSSSGTYASFTTSWSMLLFNSYNNGALYSNTTSMQLWSCKIYDNGTLIRDYYPAEIDGEIGLWDAISGVLYTDAAGGTFIAGPYLAVDTPANFEQILAVYLRWEAVDCEAYKIYRNGSLIGTTTDTFYVDITAEQNTEYTYTLIAYRGATESEPTELTVYTRSGYFVIKPLIESAFFQ